jgi:hypothetical protein
LKRQRQKLTIVNLIPPRSPRRLARPSALMVRPTTCGRIFRKLVKRQRTHRPRPRPKPWLRRFARREREHTTTTSTKRRRTGLVLRHSMRTKRRRVVLPGRAVLHELVAGSLFEFRVCEVDHSIFPRHSSRREESDDAVVSDGGKEGGTIGTDCGVSRLGVPYAECAAPAQDCTGLIARLPPAAPGPARRLRQRQGSGGGLHPRAATGQCAPRRQAGQAHRGQRTLGSVGQRTPGAPRRTA